MPNCFNCNHQFNYGDSFCSNCGRKFKAARPEATQKPKSAYPHPELKNKVFAQEKVRAKYTLIAAALIAPLTLLAVINSFITGEWLVSAGLIIANVCIPAYIIHRPRFHSEYYELPGSKLDGKHRCIYCGHKGIYKQGQYKSDKVIASCTGCEAFLYCE